MPAEYRIIKRSGAKLEYLRHEGHTHHWTPKVADAMVYTILKVASDLCAKVQGTEVITPDGKTVWITPLT